MKTPPIVFVDTETDSLDPRRRQPWDVAIIRREPDGTQVEHQFYVELDLSIADPFALKVGHFWDRHPLGLYFAGDVRNEPHPYDNGSTATYAIGTAEGNRVGQYLTARAAAHRIALLTHGARVIGAIPSFDTITLEPLLWAHRMLPMWHYHIIDVEALAVGYLRGRYDDQHLSPPWKSDELMKLLDVAPPPDAERHTALGDARWAQRVYDRVMGGPVPA